MDPNCYKELTFNIESKKKVYFHAKVYFGDLIKNAKILIDQSSEHLELGLQTLLVEEIGVSSEYGKELKYKLCTEFDSKHKDENEICALKPPYFNTLQNQQCRQLGAFFDRENKVWIFKPERQEQVEELEKYWNQDFTKVAITFKEEYTQENMLTLHGYTLCMFNTSNDVKKLQKPFSLIKGKIRAISNFNKNYFEVEEGTTILAELPLQALGSILQSTAHFLDILVLGDADQAWDDVYKYRRRTYIEEFYERSPSLAADVPNIFRDYHDKNFSPVAIQQISEHLSTFFDKNGNLFDDQIIYSEPEVLHKDFYSFSEKKQAVYVLLFAEKLSDMIEKKYLALSAQYKYEYCRFVKTRYLEVKPTQAETMPALLLHDLDTWFLLDNHNLTVALIGATQYFYKTGTILLMEKNEQNEVD